MCYVNFQFIDLFARESDNVRISNDVEKQTIFNNETLENNGSMIPSQFESIYARMYKMVN